MRIFLNYCHLFTETISEGWKQVVQHLPVMTGTHTPTPVLHSGSCEVSLLRTLVWVLVKAYNVRIVKKDFRKTSL